MITELEAREIIDDLFEEEAFVVGGMVAVHDLEDDMVWRLMKCFDVIRDKILQRLEDNTPKRNKRDSSEHSKLTAHPAIENFLSRLGKG